VGCLKRAIRSRDHVIGNFKDKSFPIPKHSPPLYIGKVKKARYLGLDRAVKNDYGQFKITF
jgi:hypothetical protein